MPSDNIICCPNCKGTGELRIEWWVVLAYQDGHDDYGPFGTLAEANAVASKYREGRNYGYQVSIEERVMAHRMEHGDE